MSEIYDALRRVQDKREGHTHPAPENGGPTNTMLEEMLHQAEAILRFTEDVQRRLSELGVDGISGVLNLYGQLRSAMDKVAQSEIEASAADITRLVGTMTTLRDELLRMKALKRTFEGMR
jgi:hypothetical protein